jgi:hypothetical protein
MAATATDSPSLPSTGLRCSLCSANENDETNKLELFLRPDDTKKSVFWLDAPPSPSTTTDSDESVSASQSHNVNAPAHLYIDNIDLQSSIFFLGGFQLVSNAKTVEIYYTTTSTGTAKNSTEEYLTTSRGIPSQETPGSFFFKVMCVVPGGPRPILRLHLKLLSLKPPSNTESPSIAKLVSLRLTARIPVPQAAAVAEPQSQPPPPTLQLQPAVAFSNTDTASNSTAASHMLASMMGTTLPQQHQHQQQQQQHQQQQHQQQQQQSVGPTMEDVGAAMAGVSFMVRSTEDRLVETMQAGFSRMQAASQQSSQHVTRHLQVLQHTCTAQTALLEQQSATIQQQHIQLEQTSHALETVKQQQQDLLVAFSSMQQQFLAHMNTANTTNTAPPRESSEPEIILEATAGDASVEEEMVEQPLEAVLDSDAVTVDEASGESSSDDIQDESDDIVFVENDATSSPEPESGKAPGTQDSEDEHTRNTSSRNTSSDRPFADGGKGSDVLILITDD